MIPVTVKNPIYSFIGLHCKTEFRYRFSRITNCAEAVTQGRKDLRILFDRLFFGISFDPDPESDMFGVDINGPEPEGGARVTAFPEPVVHAELGLVYFGSQKVYVHDDSGAWFRLSTQAADIEQHEQGNDKSYCEETDKDGQGAGITLR